MPPLTTVERRIGGVRDDRGPRPVRVTSDATTQRAQELMVALVRQGQDASLRSLQVWAELARTLGPHPRTPVDATVAYLAYDLFAKVLVAQRQVVDQLVATQRQLAQQLLNTTTVGDRGAGEATRQHNS
jgi:hypothetical protein